MDVENPLKNNPEENSNPKNVFIDTLNEELFAMEQSGKISSEQADEKRTAGRWFFR